MFVNHQRNTARKAYAFYLAVLKSGSLAERSLAFKSQEVTVHAANNIWYAAATKPTSGGEEVVDVVFLQHRYYSIFYFFLGSFCHGGNIIGRLDFVKP